MIDDMNPNGDAQKALVQSIEVGSAFLLNQREEITALATSNTEMALFSFYENLETPTVRKVSSRVLPLPEHDPRRCIPSLIVH